MNVLGVLQTWDQETRWVAANILANNYVHKMDFSPSSTRGTSRQTDQPLSLVFLYASVPLYPLLFAGMPLSNIT